MSRGSTATRSRNFHALLADDSSATNARAAKLTARGHATHGEVTPRVSQMSPDSPPSDQSALFKSCVTGFTVTRQTLHHARKGGPPPAEKMCQQPTCATKSNLNRMRAGESRCFLTRNRGGISLKSLIRDWQPPVFQISAEVPTFDLLNASANNIAPIRAIKLFHQTIYPQNKTLIPDSVLIPAFASQRIKFLSLSRDFFKAAC